MGTSRRPVRDKGGPWEAIEFPWDPKGPPPQEAEGLHGHFEAPSARQGGSLGIHLTSMGSEGTPPQEAEAPHGHFEAPSARQGGSLGIH